MAEERRKAKSWGRAPSLAKRFERLNMKESILMENMKHVLVAYSAQFDTTDERDTACLFAAEASTGVGSDSCIRWPPFAESIGAVVYHCDLAEQDLRVAFSVAIFDRSILDGSVMMSSVLQMVMGSGAPEIISCEIRDIFFPMGFIRLFDGPAMNGQDLWQALDFSRTELGMILGAVIRPRTGLLPEQLGDMCRLLWKDCDLIRSDEHHGNQVYCDVQSGIAEVVLAMKASVSTTERPKVFIATLAADDPAEMIARGKHVLKAFGLFAPNCGFQLAGPLTSLGSLTALRRAFPSQFLHYHAAGAVVAHSAGSKRGYSAFVHAKLARILGASSVLVERKVDKAAEKGMTSRQDLAEIVSMLRDDASSGPVFQQGWEGMKQALPVVSGKTNALQLPFFFESVGHSEVLVTTEVSASKRDARPGFASLRAAEEAWKDWHRLRGENDNTTLAKHLIECARTDARLLEAFEEYPDDADMLCPGWRETLNEASAKYRSRRPR